MYLYYSKSKSGNFYISYFKKIIKQLEIDKNVKILIKMNVRCLH